MGTIQKIVVITGAAGLLGQKHAEAIATYGKTCNIIWTCKVLKSAYMYDSGLPKHDPHSKKTL